MKNKVSIAVLLVLFLSCCAGSLLGYEEIKTSLGKVIIGLDKEEALREFGVPKSAGESLWRYSGTQNFLVYFKPSSLVRIQLYPQYSQVSVGSPIELKAYGYFSDFTIKDITDKVQMLINRKWDFNFSRSGVAVPLKTGKYQALVKYDNIFSNSCQITVVESEFDPKEANVRCLSIDLIPFSPVTNPNTSLSFKAFGTFLYKDDGAYYIQDITKESQWFLSDSSGTYQQKDNAILFGPRKGKARVFCRYNGRESFSQPVTLTDQPVSNRVELRHITALPEIASINIGKYITLKALGTYENNDIKDVSKRVRWKLSNKDVLVESGGRGEFFGAFEGICEAYAELEGLRSPACKVIVSPPLQPMKEGSISESAIPQKKEFTQDEPPPDTKSLLKDIKSDTEKLVKDMFGKDKKLKSIRIDPPNLKIAVGDSAQASAWGVYDDHSEEELTTLGEWRPVNEKLFLVEQGRITAYISGESDLYVKFKGITSSPARVVIEGPRLTSIVVYPDSSRISMFQNVELAAEGYFSDSSRKYITEMVNWGINGPAIVSIKKAVARPLKFGKTKVYAQYMQVKSLPADIRVIFTWEWFVFLMLNLLSLLLCAGLAVLSVFYIFTMKKKKDLLLMLEKDPRRFAAGIYENAKDIISVFGFRQKEVLPPLAYASMVDMRFTLNFYYCDSLGLKKGASIEEVKKKYHELALLYHPDKAKKGEETKAAAKFKEINEAYLALSNPRSNRTFFNFTQRFEEAKYSKHPFERGEAVTMLSEYNYFINVLLSHFNNREFALGYCLALLKRKPLRI